MKTDTTHPVDFDGRYTVGSSPGVAFRLLGYATEEVYEGDVLLCDDEDCDHDLSEMCWAVGDTSVVLDTDKVRAVMVGDDRVQLVDVDDLTPVGEDGYCGGCGQTGCGWG